MTAFSMPVADVAVAPHGRVLVMGRVAAGAVRAGDAVAVRRDDPDLTGATRVVARGRVVSLEVFGRLEVARTGDNVGLLLDGISPGLVRGGDQVVAVVALSDPPQ